MGYVILYWVWGRVDRELHGHRHLGRHALPEFRPDRAQYAGFDLTVLHYVGLSDLHVFSRDDTCVFNDAKLRCWVGRDYGGDRVGIDNFNLGFGQG